jgi:hypothetical protein
MQNSDYSNFPRSTAVGQRAPAMALAGACRISAPQADTDMYDMPVIAASFGMAGGRA